MVIVKALEVDYEQAFILLESEKVGMCKDINYEGGNLYG